MAKSSDLTTPSKQTSPPEICTLVEKFAESREKYRRPGYDETQLCQDFPDPCFVPLARGRYNRDGIYEKNRDVILERVLRVEKSVKSPDDCIRMGPVPKFFAEAKKPAVNIKGEVGPAFQLRRYPWTAELPLSTLTDGEEIAVNDCRVKPDKDDSAARAA
jgi:hypothetical protein